MTAHPKPIALVPHEETGEAPDGLPEGFAWTPRGIYRSEDGEDGQARRVWLCSPLRVLALPRDKAGTGWGRLVEVTDPDGGTHRWAIPARLFAGDGSELRGGLFDLGANLASDRKGRAALGELLQRWQPKARALTADRLGWTDEACAAFVLGDGRVLGAADVVYQAEAAPTAAAEMREAGTPEGWREAVAEPCRGSPLMMAAVSLAFAGPLLEPLAIDGGGLHLRGASSCGKSTVQHVAVSVWGSPRFLHTWRATANGLEGVASACNGSLLALDELGEVLGREASAAAYMLANGRGKGRADRAGHARRAARWRVMVLSSGELTLADKMAEGGARIAAGQAVRLLDVAADVRRHGAFDALHGAPDGAAFADRLRDATAEHYGTAGPAFVRALLSDLDAVRGQTREALAGFRGIAAERFGIGDEGQAVRAAERLGLIAAAGELATAWGLTGWPVGMARDAALDVLGLWLDGRGGAGPAEAREAVERTRAFIVAHGGSRFEDLERSAGALPVANRAGWRDGECFYFARPAWADLHRSSDSARAARHVAEAGFLRRVGVRDLTIKAPRAVPHRPRVYAVVGAILGEGDGEGDA